MLEAHGRRATLTFRIRYGHYASNGFGLGVALFVLLALIEPPLTLWLAAGAVCLAAMLVTIRVVNAYRIELYQMGKPGPSLAFEAASDEE